VVGCWRGYLSGARCRLAYGPADATATHCLLDWFRYWLTRVVPDKGPLNACVWLPSFQLRRRLSNSLCNMLWNKLCNMLCNMSCAVCRCQTDRTFYHSGSSKNYLDIGVDLTPYTWIVFQVSRTLAFTLRLVYFGERQAHGLIYKISCDLSLR